MEQLQYYGSEYGTYAGGALIGAGLSGLVLFMVKKLRKKAAARRQHEGIVFHVNEIGPARQTPSQYMHYTAQQQDYAV